MVTNHKLKQPSEKQHWDLLEEEVGFEVNEEGRPPSEFFTNFPYVWKKHEAAQHISYQNEDV